MPLPHSILDWSEAARTRYHELQKLCASLHDYIDVTDEIAARVTAICRKAEEIDSGDGLRFTQAGNVIKKVFLTQTFH